MKILISMVGIAGLKDIQVKIPFSPAAESAQSELSHQSALIRAINPDLVLLVGTKEAKAKNAQNILPNFREDQFVEIPKCEKNDEFWEMFELLTQKLDSITADNRKPHEIYLDLTFGFRTQPMLVSAAIRYACNLYPNKFKLQSVYYSVLEEDKNSKKADKGTDEILPPQTPASLTATVLQVDPIIDLEYIAQDINLLLSYSVTGSLSTRLKEYGNLRTAAIADQLKKDFTPQSRSEQADFNARFGELKKDDSVLSILNRLIATLDSFGAVISINHTPSAATTVQNLCKLADEAAKEFVNELKPVGIALLKMKNDLTGLLPQNPDPLWGWHAALAKWCLERGLDQQALTHAEEMITTRACEEAGFDPLAKENRNRCGSPLKAMCLSKDHTDYVTPPAEFAEIIKAWNAVSTRRNGVNHAFTGNPTEQEADKIRAAIKNEVERLLAANAGLKSWPKIV